MNVRIAKLFTAIAALVFSTAALSAEVLTCEFWSAGDIPTDPSSATFAEAQKRFRDASVSVEKGDPTFATLATLKSKAAKLTQIPASRYQYMTRVSVFRRMATGEMKVIVDGKDSSSVPLSDVYDTDLIVFHAFVVR